MDCQAFQDPLQKREEKWLSFLHHIGAVCLVTCPTSTTLRSTGPSSSWATIPRMRRPLTSAVLLLAACGARLSDSSRDDADAALPPDAAARDAGLDATPL